jgi:hypothetical protein
MNRRLFIICFLLLINIDKANTPKQTLNVIKGKSPQEVALQFYNWYLKKVYLKSPLNKPNVMDHPEVKIVNTTYQIVSKNQFEKLKETGFFSDEFFKNELVVFNACNVQLKKVKIKDVEECGCSPATFVKTSDCDFLEGYTWVGGQGEDLKTVKISKVVTMGDKSKVTATIGDGTVDYSHPIVSLIKENNEWKIAKIDLRY